MRPRIVLLIQEGVMDERWNVKDLQRGVFPLLVVVGVLALLSLAAGALGGASRLPAQAAPAASLADAAARRVPPAPPQLTPTPTCQLGWRLVSSPNMGTNHNYLLGVAPVATADA